MHAARSAVHDIARIGRLHTRAGVVEETVTLARAVLDAPVDDGPLPTLSRRP